MPMKLLYLCAPYTYADEKVRRERVSQSVSVQAALMEKGYAVFNPISHGHAVAHWVSEPSRSSSDFWLAQDFPILAASDLAVLLPLPGWDRSEGVARELSFARHHSIDLFVIQGFDDLMYETLSREQLDKLRPDGVILI